MTGVIFADSTSIRFNRLADVGDQDGVQTEPHKPSEIPGRRELTVRLQRIRDALSETYPPQATVPCPARYAAHDAAPLRQRAVSARRPAECREVLAEVSRSRPRRAQRRLLFPNWPVGYIVSADSDRHGSIHGGLLNSSDSPEIRCTTTLPARADETSSSSRFMDFG